MPKGIAREWPSDEELLELGADHNGVVTEMARALGVAAPTLRYQLDQRNILAQVQACGDVVEGVSRESMLEEEVRRLRKAVNSGRKTDIAEALVLQAINESLAVVPLPKWAGLSSKANRNEADAHHRQAILLSDWHGGEVVDPEQVGGLNEFNWSILERRVEETYEALLSFKKVRPKLTGLDVWLLGDMVSGDIHEELSTNNEYPVAEQSVKVGHLIGQLVVKLAAHYPDLHIVGVSGNHARTKKPHASKNVFDSWDWTAYQIAQAYTRGIEHVTWETPRSGTVVRTIAGLNILIKHGDGVKSSMPGVPWGGVMRRWNAEVQSFAREGTRLHGIAFGHWHQANVIHGRLFGNGSLIGLNEYGYKNFGDGEEPKQLLLTFDERKQRLTDVAFITPA